MSLSGSSASRKSSWAITRFARSSSMKVGRKMMRSFNRREKMSNARSPRGVCSITIGTRAIGDLLIAGTTTPEPWRGRRAARGSDGRAVRAAAPRGRRSSPSYAGLRARAAGSPGRPSPARRPRRRRWARWPRARLVARPPRLEPRAHLGTERLEARELSERLRELVVQVRKHLLLHLDEPDGGRPAASAQLL